MTRSIVRALALGAALGLAGAAAAEPINVEYYVSQKAFKKGTTGTDVLDFRLYEDEACSVEIGSFPIFASDPFAHFFVDKNQRLLGGRRLPKAVRIRAVIEAPLTTSAPYLRVTGHGIVPVGEACQLQGVSPIAAVGSQGDPGPAGPAGADGAVGPQGDAGQAGPVGVDGAMGPEGLPGDPGPAGPAGADGAVGPQGPQGDAGPAGPAGADGAVGLQGPQGDVGPAGLAGADGAVGPQGPQGDVGPAGSAGADGAVGPQGPQGDAGPAGPAGPEGPAGSAGADGAVGPQGPAGLNGTSGSLLGGNYPNTGDGNFLSPFNPSVGSEANTNLPVTNGTASKLIVNVGSALGAGESVALTVRKNGVDAGLSCTVAAGADSCTNMGSSVAFGDGDLMSIRYNETGNPNSRVRFTVVYKAP